MQKLAAITLALCSALGFANELPTNVVSFDTVASRDVANDTAHATLFVELTDTDPAHLSERVNLAIDAGVKQVRRLGNIVSMSTGYSTYPLYNKSNKQEGWRARGEVNLTSRDFAAMAKLIGELQKIQDGTPLQLADVRYDVSDAARKQAEDELIEEGLRGFRNRAALVQKGLSSKSWKLVNLTINTQSARPPVMYKAALMAERAMPSAALAPVEGGESRLSVNIQGQIQLE
ncbi:MAG: SIMPL domain-containing protein [Formivibrio sp.]|nr:SIMPL domain-containing protein [Formivibrio sp.]